MSITESFNLEQAIQALEAQRAVLGDEIVDAALGPLREKVAALKARAAPEQSIVPVDSQQRRLVTVLFADVSGFTAMSEHLDAEDVRDTMNALWERLDRVIIDNGGRIDKHMGDGVMALWGADEIREDDVERAIRAALSMQDELGRFQPTIRAIHDLKMRIGINTGPALLGLIGTRGEFTAMGDTVNLASRLEQACPSGGILISHDTYRHVRGVFNVEPQVPLEIKGKSEPVHTYLARSIKPRAFRLYTRGIEGVETRMIGRDRELAQLGAIFENSFYQKKMRVVTVYGEAGLGKSRLLYEFNTWAELQTITWWWFKGRASLSMMSTPFALLRDIFAFRFEIQDSDPLPVTHEKMERGFRDFLPGDGQSIEKAHVIGHLLGFNFSESPYLRGLLQDPRQLRQQALFYLTQFFSVVSTVNPILVMVDDLQWADTGSLDALLYILKNLPEDTRLMMLAVSRPALFERYSRWKDEIPDYTALALSPLSKDDSRRLVEEILRKVPDLPAAVRELVVGGAEGNPFYVEELIKMLIDNRVILPGDEAWTVEPGRLATVNIPTTLTEVLQARLDGLSPLERTTLQLASVVGRIFWDDAIVALAENTPEHEIHDALVNLRRKELIFDRRPSGFIGTNEYTFKHSLLYEVTYDTLLKRQRAVYHVRVAEWLEKISAGRRADYLGQIAEHYEKGGDVPRAAAVLSESAERALSLSALADAHAIFEHALSLLAQPDRPARDVIKMELGLAGTCYQMGDYPGALSHSERAASMATDLKLDELVAESLVVTGETLMLQGEYQNARSYLLGALYLARQENARAVIARVLVGLASVEWRLGSLEQAHEYAHEAHVISTEVGDSLTLLLALNRLGAVEGALGNLDDEAHYYQECLTLATSIGNRERASTALNNLGAQAGEQKQWQKAWDYYSQALELSRQTGAQQPLALHMINLGFAGVALDRWDESRRYLRQGVALAYRLGAMPAVIFGILYYAVLLHRLGLVDHALEVLGSARKQPAWDNESEREMTMYIDDWGLDPERVHAGLERGATLDWNEVIHEVMAE